MIRLATLGFACIASSAALAACPSNHITGNEAQTWTIEINVAKGTYEAVQMGNGEQRTAKAAVTCEGNNVKIQHSEASDNNNCAYTLTLQGTKVDGTYTCSKRPGPFTFTGNFD